MSKVYDIVANNIIKKIEDAIKENKKFTWVKPWNSVSIPRNFITKKPYRGINLLLLDDPGFYVSFKQLTELQKKYPFLKLKKGCKKQMVVFWSFVKTKNEERNDTEENEIAEDENKKSYKKSTPIFKYYNVFNQKDIEGFDQIIPEEYKVKDIELEDSKAMRLCEEYGKIVNMQDIDIDRACYSPLMDCIKVPPRGCYDNENEYYATKFHEMIHSTGHKSRLNRFEENSYFGDVAYSKEELVAEIGSQMLLAECGIEDESVDSNAIAYLNSWLGQIKKDITLITYAAQRAQKACDYIIKETKINEVEIDSQEIA